MDFQSRFSRNAHFTDTSVCDVADELSIVHSFLSSFCHHITHWTITGLSPTWRLSQSLLRGQLRPSFKNTCLIMNCIVFRKSAYRKHFSTERIYRGVYCVVLTSVLMLCLYTWSLDRLWYSRPSYITSAAERSQWSSRWSTCLVYKLSEWSSTISCYWRQCICGTLHELLSTSRICRWAIHVNCLCCSAWRLG